MSDITEINDYKVVKTLSKSDEAYTLVVISKGLQNMSEDYFKIMKLKKIPGKEELSADIETDISIIGSFEHQNIAPYETYFFTKLEQKTYLAVLRPYYKSNIADVANFVKFTAADSEMCDKIIKAINYVHDKYSMILTLKKSNCFVDSNGEVQITDIGIPSLLEYELEKKKKNLKLAMYTPPEIDEYLVGINYKVDVWGLGILFYELYKKCHPFEESTPKDALKLVNREFVGVELNEGIIDDIIRGCLKQKPSERLTLAGVRKHIRELIEKENIDFGDAEVRRLSYGLASPNREFNATKRESGTERLDDPSEEQKIDHGHAGSENFFQVINKNGFSNETYQEILYNGKMRDEGTDQKEKFRCVNTATDCHKGQINGIEVLDTGLLITSGDDKCIHFWNPMNNDLIAVVNESSKVGKLLTLPKVKEFYYVIGAKVKSFDYSTGIATVIYEGMSNITCLEIFQNGENNLLIVGLKDGTIELVNRIHRKVTLSKPFHSGYSVVGVSGKGDYLLSAGTDDVVNIYNVKSTLLESELNLKNANFDGLTGILKLTQNENEMIVTDQLFGISWFSFDVDNSSKEHPDISYRPVVQLFDNVSPNENLFGATDEKGLIKIYSREGAEEEGQTTEIIEIRKFRGHKGQVTGIAHFRDGSYVTCSVDGTYKIWTSRKDIIRVGKADGSKGCCSGGKCIIQ
ncbi:unnamed protein product [Moneuplotes crassus]|uniref:non-specific serine/threonine protein kinase n=2 Tax=Euplotes crassus TaxID=5936 RepID=A0AAD1TYW0_EUPCR|nr:unnamed protein product [Moneuplotes crassus]